MADADGGDGSVRTGVHEEVEPSVASAGEEHGQDSASSSQDHAEGDGREQKRGFSNSTSGRKNSTASWGDWDCSWDEDRHWGDQWRGDGWRGWRSGWHSSWDDDHSRDDDDYQDETWDEWSHDPWAEAWKKKRDGDGARRSCGHVTTIETATDDQEIALPRQMVELNSDRYTTDLTGVAKVEVCGVDGSTLPAATRVTQVATTTRTV